MEILTKGDGKLLATGTQENGLNILDTTTSSTNSVSKSLSASSVPIVTGELSRDLWHQHLMHVNKTNLEMLPPLVDGIKFSPEPPTPAIPVPCIPCIEAKPTQMPFPKVLMPKVKKPFEKIHMDLQKFGSASYNGKRYNFLIRDDYTQTIISLPTANKSKGFDKFRTFVALIENQHDCKDKIAQTNNGGEFFSGKMEEWCRERGIVVQTSITNNPDHNGVAERSN